MNSQPYIIEEDDVSKAWARAILKLLDVGVEEISPLIVNINLSPKRNVETSEIRAAADIELEKYDKCFPCHTTANTIFPTSLWDPRKERQHLFDRYLRILPRLKQCQQNRMGIYFERLIAFNESNNQLDHILNAYEKGVTRRSEFQAITVNPDEDQCYNPQKGFPCLRQVMFISTPEGLVVSGVYGVQYIFDRGYGNYLGLVNLGKFMAHEMKIPLVRVQCMTTIATLGTPNKSDLKPMAQSFPQFLEEGICTNFMAGKFLNGAGEAAGQLSMREELYA